MLRKLYECHILLRPVSLNRYNVHVSYNSYDI